MALWRRAAAAHPADDGHVFELWFTGVLLALSVAMFFCMPARLAKATLFLFLTNTTSVSFGSAMQYWFTVDESATRGGCLHTSSSPCARR